MCDADEAPSFYADEWRRARKRHTCCACDETIQKDHLYHYAKGLWDGYFATFKHCARCWRLFDNLNQRNPGEVQLGLDCGEEYEGPETDPMYVMAFMTPEEAQRYAARQLHGPQDTLAYRAASYARYGNPIEHKLKWKRLASAPMSVRRTEMYKEDT